MLRLLLLTKKNGRQSQLVIQKNRTHEGNDKKIAERV